MRFEFNVCLSVSDVFLSSSLNATESIGFGIDRMSVIVFHCMRTIIFGQLGFVTLQRFQVAVNQNSHLRRMYSDSYISGRLP